MSTLVFLGIGGIGMSGLARYMKAQGCTVYGYDQTETLLTDQLTKEGIEVIYTASRWDYSPSYTPPSHWKISPHHTLVVRTAAIHDNHPLYTYFAERGFRVIKRAELLGEITAMKRALCVAGTHGKTTTSSILSHIMHGSALGGSAFLGGICLNYHSNIILDSTSPYVVVEADEYDHSFLHLSPEISVITSIDPDHLDIYGDAAGFQQGFDDYAALVRKAIVLKKGYSLHGSLQAVVYSYSVTEKADFYATNIRAEQGQLWYDLHLLDTVLESVRVGVPAMVNVENSLAAAAAAYLAGASVQDIRRGIETFHGVERRFNVRLAPSTQYPDMPVLIDDYAHHPTELQRTIESVRFLYPDYRLVTVFQPHLFTRTRDFMSDFAKVLSTADDLILLPIYPAREEPIEGVTSEALAEQCVLARPGCHARVMTKAQMIDYFGEKQGKNSVILMVGAGDIGEQVARVEKKLIVNN